MRFSRKINCQECKRRCDIYTAFKESPYSFEDLSPLHAFYKKHDVICKQETEVSHALFLVDGTAKLYIEGLNNRNITLYILKPPSFIGLLSFFESVRYSYSVAALEDSQICMIDLNFVKKLYIENHELLIQLNKAFGKSVANIMRKVISLNQKQIRGRFAESLLYLAELHKQTTFNIGLSRKELGELSAISEENTVRLLTELKNENIISLIGRQIEILDVQLLKKISEVG